MGGIGRINSGKNEVVFRVRTLKEVLLLIDFFDLHPLITQKKADYNIFKQVALIMKDKQHLTPSRRSRRIIGNSEIKDIS